MRKFLIELDSVIGIDELKKDFYEKFENTEKITFARYLELCMWWNNGALTEILTDETPPEMRSRAVTYYHAVCSETDGDEYWLWATESHAKILAGEGYRVEKCPKLGC